MITFYIDESGNIDAKDITNQPVFIFCGVGITNEKYCEVNDFMINQVKNLEKLINKKIINRLKSNTNFDVIKMFKSKVCNNLEIHMNELVRGNEEYVLLSSKDKDKIITNIVNFVKDKSLDIIAIKYDKRNGIINKSDVEDKIQKSILEEYNSYMLKISRKAILVFDEGNSIVKNKFSYYSKENVRDNICPQILQANSLENPLIQLADVIAYIIRSNFQGNGKYSKNMIKHFQVIKDNIHIVDIK